MQTNQITSFIDAVKSAGLKNYSFADDTNVVFYNNDNSFILIDEAKETLINVRKTYVTGVPSSENPITISASDFLDIRRAEISGTAEQIKKFCESYGLSLTDDQLKIIVNIEGNNRILKPITGDYTVVYHKLSKAEYEALSDEEKAAYDAKVKEDNKRFEIPKGSVGIVDIR